jgi:hypothetical protein
MPTIQWLLYADNGLAPYGRRLTMSAVGVFAGANMPLFTTDS